MWSDVPYFLSEPVRWATWATLRPQSDLFEFPFVMLWGLPLAAMVIAWPLRQGGSARLAIWVATFPILYLGTLVACFYVIPTFMLN
jgi:hypothetical protein